MAKASALWKQLRTFALALPEAYEDAPWGDRVVKVRKKIFVFLGDGDAPDSTLGLKLAGESQAAALALPGAAPMRYGLGKSGWVVIALHGSGLAAAVFEDWIAESYGLVAPKKLAAQIRS
jgi:predicted DNA-binding protein (MmcQ/YjbR family)